MQQLYIISVFSNNIRHPVTNNIRHPVTNNIRHPVTNNIRHPVTNSFTKLYLTVRFPLVRT
jgi:hypothetical protein